jgi:hypothetical protein
MVSSRKVAPVVDTALDTATGDTTLKASAQDHSAAELCGGHFLPPPPLWPPPRDTSAVDGVQR